MVYIYYYYKVVIRVVRVEELYSRNFKEKNKKKKVVDTSIIKKKKLKSIAI
jgi:hypothetical protein